MNDKIAAAEPGNATDKFTGKQITITTAVRILFRKLNPDWAKVPNKVLNPYIAKVFTTSSVIGNFKPKKGGNTAVGEYSQVNGMRFAAIIDSSSVRIIGVKGSAKLSAPPKIQPGMPTKVAYYQDAAESMKGYLSDHMKDIVLDMYNLDHNSYDTLVSHLSKFGPDYLETLKKLHHGKTKKEMDTIIGNFLNKDQRVQMANQDLYRDMNVADEVEHDHTAIPMPFSIE